MTTDPWHLRPITDDEFPSYRRVFREALSTPRDPDAVDPATVTRMENTLAAFDGGRIVGTTVAHPLEMALPGGVRRIGGVSAVGVWPTHRRRGILTALMRRQLADLREQGVAVAALFASEGAIYGRFGYGQATRPVDVEVRTRIAALRSDLPHDPALELRFGLASEMRAGMEAAHRAAAPQRTGEFHRTSDWWDTLLKEEDRTKLMRVAVAERGGVPQGYVSYRAERAWLPHGPVDGKLEVVEMFAADPACAVLLWRHVLERDMMAAVHAPMLPPDDALFHLFTDPDQVRSLTVDGMWVRLVDAARALEERSYAAPVDVVLDITDRHCPWNEGRRRLRASAAKAECLPTDAPADIAVDVSALGSAYLGGVRLRAIADAGLVTETTPGATAALDLALTTHRAPHCSTVF